MHTFVQFDSFYFSYQGALCAISVSISGATTSQHWVCIQQFAGWVLWPGNGADPWCAVGLWLPAPAPQDKVSLRKTGSESFLFTLRHLPALQLFTLTGGCCPRSCPSAPRAAPGAASPAQIRHLQLFPSGIIYLLIKGC